MKKLLVAMLLAIAATAGAVESKPVLYSDFQRGFMQIVLEYAQKYPKAENELQKSALVTERSNRFKTLKGDPRQIKDWMGVLETMGTNGDGKAYVTIRLSPKVLSVSTYNNSFSDVDDHSLIPQSSKIYSKLAAMRVGNVVKFSGRLKRTTNITEAGKMTEPDFLFIFSDIEKIGESAIPY